MLPYVLDQGTRNQARRRRVSLRNERRGARHSGPLQCEADLSAHRPAQEAARPELAAPTPTHSSSGTVLDVHHESLAGPVEVAGSQEVLEPTERGPSGRSKSRSELPYPQAERYPPLDVHLIEPPLGRCVQGHSIAARLWRRRLAFVRRPREARAQAGIVTGPAQRHDRRRFRTRTARGRSSARRSPPRA
jgi:hypothetical protein